VLRKRPGLGRNVADLNAVIVERGAEPSSVAFFRVCAGALRGPASLVLDQRVASPVPLDEQIRLLLGSLAPAPQTAGSASETARQPDAPPALPLFTEPDRTGTKTEPRTAGLKASPLPPWEHLTLLARWYYSSFREGEFVLLGRDQEIPHARLIRICRKLTNA
jgi:hypothetical protein